MSENLPRRPFLSNSAPSAFKTRLGQWLTKALFVEYLFEGHGGFDAAMYTLKDEDITWTNGKTYPSLRRLYLDCNDPTEYAFAQKYFYSWEHWQRVASAPWMRPLLAVWQVELEMKIRSQALAQIISVANSDRKESLTAARFIVEGGYKHQKAGKGAPTKADIARAAHALATENTDVSEDAKRLGLTN